MSGIYRKKRIERIKMSEEGMTLVEILTAIVILSVAIGSSVAVFGKCNIYANEIRQRSIVNHALNEEMERVRGMSYANILTLPSSFTTSELSQLPNATGTLTLEDAFAHDRIRKATLTISWTSPEGRALSESMAALVMQSGINRQ